MEKLFENLRVTSYELRVTICDLRFTSFAFCFLLSAFCFLPGALFAQKQKAETQTKVFTKNFSVNPKDILEVNTHYTKITFQEWNRNEIDFTTTVTLNKATEKEMEQLLNAISITTNQSGKKTKYKLTLSGNKLKLNGYEIELLVKIPNDIFLDIKSSFGNVELEDALNNLNADIDFGNLTVKNLFGNENTIVIKQGKLKLRHADQLTLNMDFSKGDLREIGTLKLKSSFSTLTIDRANRVELSSSQDKISIVSNIDHIEGKMDFGTLKINSLKYSCVFKQFSFSKISIEEVLRSFTQIHISSSQSTIVLNVPQDQSFAFDYSGSFTKFKDQNIKLNDATFKAESNSVQMNGIYGKNPDSGKKIKIEASFGSVSLFE